jgi:hypothetical protein
VDPAAPRPPMCVLVLVLVIILILVLVLVLVLVLLCLFLLLLLLLLLQTRWSCEMLGCKLSQRCCSSSFASILRYVCVCVDVPTRRCGGC